MWNGKLVSVVFPAYNEAPNIERAVTDFQSIRHTDGTPVIDEILVVDNNSVDGTGDLASEVGARVLIEPNQGYGNALKCGLSNASGDLIILCEPDGTFVAQDTLKFLAYSGDFEMVCGTRTTRELIWEEANMGWFLRIGNMIVAKVLEVLYGTPSLSDCGCTFRLIRRDAVQKMLADLHVGKSHFLPNMIIAARFNRVSMIEIPVSYRGRVGESKITGSLKNTWKTGLSMIFLILVYWPKFIVIRLFPKAQATVIN